MLDGILGRGSEGDKLAGRFDKKSVLITGYTVIVLNAGISTKYHVGTLAVTVAAN